MHYHKKKMLVKHLVIILKELQENKEQKTIIEDDYYNYLLTNLPKDQEELTRSLIHYLTLLNKSFREKERGIYQSTNEDIVLALELVQDLIKPKSILSQKEQNRLEELEQSKLEQHFTRQEVQRKLQLSKSQTHRFLNKLENLQLIQKESSPKNQSHTYSFGIPSIEIQELFTDNQHIEFMEIR